MLRAQTGYRTDVANNFSIKVTDMCEERVKKYLAQKINKTQEKKEATLKTIYNTKKLKI